MKESMKQMYYLAVFLCCPFLIAAAFHFTDWAGWPTLIVLGMYWIGALILLCSKKAA